MNRLHHMASLANSSQHKRVPASPVRPAPLPVAERAYFERRLGHDFSRVRVHTDETAAALASGLGAKALAVGKDIAFARGQYRPETPEGRNLLAHELVHVAQQDRGGGGWSTAESGARSAALRVEHGESVSPQEQGTAPQAVYCDSDDEKKKPDTAVPSSFTFSPLASSRPSLLGQSPLAPGPGFGLPRPLLASPTLLPTGPSPLGPLVPPYHLMVNADLLAPFSAYGTTPSLSGIDIRGDWAKAYFMFRNYLPESLAATSANIALASAYQSSLGFNQPSIFDKADLDFKAAYPNDKRIPVIPAISSGTLTKVYELITKKKDTNAFYF